MDSQQEQLLMLRTTAFPGRSVAALWVGAVLLGGCSENVDSAANVVHAIEIEHVGSLVDDEGPGGSYGGQANLTLLNDGRLVFWDHYRPTRVRVYASDFQLDTVLGRAGLGPGEFQRPRFHGVIGDTLVIYQETGRLELFDKDDFRHLDTRLGRLGRPMAMAFSPGGYAVANSLDMSAEGIGLPLREIGTSGEVRAAFGADVPVLIGMSTPLHARELAFAPDGSLWVLPAYEPRLERWKRTGGEEPTWDLDTAFVLSDIPMDDPREYVGIVRTTDAPPSPQFEGVSQVAEGPVWLALSIPHPQWRDRLWQDGDGAELYSAPSMTQRVTRVLAIDPDTGEILADQVRDERWMGFIGQDIAYSWDQDELGVPYIELWRPRLVTEAPGMLRGQSR